MNKKIILGFDGGASHSTCVLFYNQGQSITYIQDKGSNLSLYKEEGVKVILAMINDICKKAKIDINEIACFGLGVAGVSDKTMRDFLFSNLESIGIKGNIFITSDVEGAYQLIFPFSNGVIINVGTGVICLAKNNKKTIKIAGKGHYSSDKGSGFWIGKELLLRISSNDLSDFGQHDIEECIKIIIKNSDYKDLDGAFKYYADLVQGVSRTANLAGIMMDNLNNEIIFNIIQEATIYIGQYIIEIYDLLNFNQGDLIIGGCGSIMKNDVFRDLVEQTLSFEYNNINWLFSNLSSAYGAGLLAADLNNIDYNFKEIVKDKIV